MVRSLVAVSFVLLLSACAGNRGGPLGGTARWEAYLQHCREHGHEPVSRGAFERARTDAKASTPGARCC